MSSVPVTIGNEQPAAGAAPNTPVEMGGSSRSQRNNRTWEKNQNNNPQVGSNERARGGAKPEIGAVLGLRMEKLDNKVSFEVFRKKMINHVLSEFKNPNHIIAVLKKMVHPMEGLRRENKVQSLTEEEKKMIWRKPCRIIESNCI